MKKYADKNILVTGGTRGIGRKTVEFFCKQGGNVYCLYKNSDMAAKEIESSLGANCIKCDISEPEEVNNAVKHNNIHDIDILILNAGISDIGLINDMDVQSWNKIIDTNLNSAFYIVKNVLPDMISKKNGSIITVSSMWGQVGASCEVAYSASKAGLIGFTKALAKELGPSNIRVNSVSPGFIETDMNAGVDSMIKKEIKNETPLNILGQTEDVVRAIDFFASENSEFITGQIIGVNGGLII